MFRRYRLQDGAEPFLDNMAAEHNGLVFKDFIERYKKVKAGEMTVKKAADDFGVHRDSWYRWVNQYESDLVA